MNYSDLLATKINYIHIYLYNMNIIWDFESTLLNVNVDHVIRIFILKILKGSWVDVNIWEISFYVSRSLKSNFTFTYTKSYLDRSYVYKCTKIVRKLIIVLCLFKYFNSNTTVHTHTIWTPNLSSSLCVHFTFSFAFIIFGKSLNIHDRFRVCVCVHGVVCLHILYVFFLPLYKYIYVFCFLLLLFYLAQKSYLLSYFFPC